jgi:hypothetical protein
MRTQTIKFNDFMKGTHFSVLPAWVLNMPIEVQMAYLFLILLGIGVIALSKLSDKWEDEGALENASRVRLFLKVTLRVGFVLGFFKATTVFADILHF